MTPEKHCDRLPCSDHKIIFGWVCAFYILVMSTMIWYMAANNNRAVASEIAISEKIVANADATMERFTKILEDRNKLFYDIIQRLSRIEAKVQ